MPALVRFLVAFCATLAAAATVGKLVPHIPRLATELSISLGMAGFLVSSVMLPGAFAGPLFGALADRFAPKRIALVGLAVAALASALLPLASSAMAFLSLRIIEGIGYTMLVVAATLIVVDVKVAGPLRNTLPPDPPAPPVPGKPTLMVPPGYRRSRRRCR